MGDRVGGASLFLMASILGCAPYNPVLQAMPYEARVRGDRDSLRCAKIALGELGFEFYAGDVASGWLHGVKETHFTPSPGRYRADEHVRIRLVDGDEAQMLELRYGLSRYEDKVDPASHPQEDVFFARPPPRNLDRVKEAMSICQKSVFEGNAGGPNPHHFK